jgi:hypothetical protein
VDLQNRRSGHDDASRRGDDGKGVGHSGLLGESAS